MAWMVVCVYMHDRPSRFRDAAHLVPDLPSSIQEWDGSAAVTLSRLQFSCRPTRCGKPWKPSRCVRAVSACALPPVVRSRSYLPTLIYAPLLDVAENKIPRG